MPYRSNLRDGTRGWLEANDIEVCEEFGGVVFVCKACKRDAPAKKRKVLHAPGKALTHAETHIKKGVYSRS
jgi:hypothetical protein